MRIFKYISAILLITFVACNPVPEIDDATMLDGDQIFDLSLTQPEKYLVSEYLPTPTEAQKDTPVIIAAHGYTATTFEWDELRDFADSARTFYVSQVLLGGHDVLTKTSRLPTGRVAKFNCK
jgi:carboxylesterase